MARSGGWEVGADSRRCRSLSTCMIGEELEEKGPENLDMQDMSPRAHVVGDLSGS